MLVAEAVEADLDSGVGLALVGNPSGLGGEFRRCEYGALVTATDHSHPLDHPLPAIWTTVS